MNAPPALGYAPGVSLAPDRQHSPTAASFGSNNPFRNRALSPSVAGSVSSNNRPERPRSTNPFLDDSEALSPQSAPGMGSTPMLSPTEKTDISSNTRQLFESLSLKPEPQSTRRPSNDQPTSRQPQSTSTRNNALDIFADPPRNVGSRPPRRPRRNSESSVMDQGSKLLDVDDAEKRRRERRHREREGRSKDKDGKPRSSRRDRRLDIIDKLDVTSIYGTGMFHHDGPFDACNPHRNRRGARTAPMQAFPKNSTNMALGGSGPNNSNINLDLFHGRMEEGNNDFATAARVNASSGIQTFNPTDKTEYVHGDESAGLGTSTFLDGTPASRAAMARRKSENEASLAPTEGLSRTKSLAQRLRGVPGRIAPTNRIPPAYSGQGSGQPAPSQNINRTPHFQDQDYDAEWDKKGSSIENRAEGGRLRASSSPKQATDQPAKTDQPANDRYEESKLNPGGGGFLNRMKSLRKPKQLERRTSD